MCEVGFTFDEVMEGTVRREGEARERSFRFEVQVASPSVLGLFGTTTAELRGRVTLEGVAQDARTRGTLELSPFWGRWMRYRLEFVGDDGHAYRFEGKKTITTRRHLESWTTLYGTLFDELGAWGSSIVRFSLKRDLGVLLRSLRLKVQWRAA